jgi:hypothetical protein
MKRKLIFGLVAVGGVLVLVPLGAAFEAHVINVTAQILDAITVIPQSIKYGTVFPQEFFQDQSFLVTFSPAFLAQNALTSVEYRIAQKPKPRNTQDTDFCHQSAPQDPGNPNDPYYVTCYPNFCKYLSKEPDNFPPASKNDEGVAVPHATTPRCADSIDNEGDGFTDFPADPQCASLTDDSETQAGEQAYGFGNSYGRIHKSSDISDQWLLDFPVPCFEGQCDQDYIQGVAQGTKENPLPSGLESQVFGCDLWVEVTNAF